MLITDAQDIIKDEPDIRLMIEEALSLPGYRITAAEDGQQALQLFSEKEGWDLVVLELMLPKVDGLTVWDENFLKDENVINVTIRRLREKIEDNPSAPSILRPSGGSVIKWERGKRSEACDMSGGGEPVCRVVYCVFL